METKQYKVNTITKNTIINTTIEATTPEVACAIAENRYGGLSFITKTGELSTGTLIMILNARSLKI